MCAFGYSTTVKALFLTLSALACVAPLEAQNQLDVQDITRQFNAIQDRLAGVVPIHREYTDERGYGVVTAYLEDGTVAKLVVQSIEESHGRISEYFFSQGAPVFVFEVADQFGGSLPSDRSGVTQDRYYFVGGQLARWMESATDVPGGFIDIPPTDSRFRERSKELLADAQRWGAYVQSSSNQE